MSDSLRGDQLPKGVEAAFQEILSKKSKSQSVITGLVKRPDLNGIVCTTGHLDTHTGRVTCSFIDAKGNEKKIAIKPSNLREK